MTKNVGGTDRVIRIVGGVLLLSLLFILEAPLSYAGLIGIVPIGTALINFCPLYTVLGINTCARKPDNPS